MSFWSLLAVLFASFDLASSHILSCYVTLESLQPSEIDPFLCTHLILIGGSTVDEYGAIILPPLGEMLEFNELKKKNEQLKILLSITPRNAYMSKVVVSNNLTTAFVNDITQFLLDSGLDGFDVDWEYPVWSSDSRKSDKKGLTLLLQRLRSAFDASGRSLLLTLAVGAPYTISREAYDVAALNTYADFVQIMNYDYHIFSRYEPFTGFNAPLRAEFYELGPARRMNSDYSTRYWLKMGLNKNKTLFGIPTYARGFRLLTKYLHFPYAPATGLSLYGGSLTYGGVCSFLNSTNAAYVWNSAASSPYVHSNREWLSIEDRRSVQAKAQYAKDMGLAGVMVFALQTDDSGGQCGFGRYPLTKTVKAVFAP